MATVPRTRATVQHYAYLGDLYGTAELVNGSGYLFRADGQRTATLVSYKDADLMLLGLVEVADGQYEVDMLVGGPASICTTRDEGRS